MKIKKVVLLATLMVATCGSSISTVGASTTPKTADTTIQQTPEGSTVDKSKKDMLSNYWMYIGVLAVLLLLIVLMVWMRRRGQKS